MNRISPFNLPFFFLSILSSTDRGSPAHHTISGKVVDEKGNSVDGADVLIESATDRRHTISAVDGRFFFDIQMGGSFDEIYIKALYGIKSGAEKIYAHGSHSSVDIMVRDIEQ